MTGGKEVLGLRGTPVPRLTMVPKPRKTLGSGSCCSLCPDPSVFFLCLDGAVSLSGLQTHVPSSLGPKQACGIWPA